MKNQIEELISKLLKLNSIIMQPADYKGRLVLFTEDKIENFPDNCGLYKYNVLSDNYNDNITVISDMQLINEDTEILKSSDIVQLDDIFFNDYNLKFSILDLLIDKDNIISIVNEKDYLNGRKYNKMGILELG